MNGMCLVSKKYTDYEIKNKNSYENTGKHTNKKQRVGIYNLSKLCIRHTSSEFIYLKIGERSNLWQKFSFQQLNYCRSENSFSVLKMLTSADQLNTANLMITENYVLIPSKSNDRFGDRFKKCWSVLSRPLQKSSPIMGSMFQNTKKHAFAAPISCLQNNTNIDCTICASDVSKTRENNAFSAAMACFRNGFSLFRPRAFTYDT